MSDEPPRLAEGSDELGALLRAARDDVPSAEQLKGVSQGLTEAIATAAGAGLAAGGVGGGKVVVGLVTACVVGAVTIYGVIQTAPPPLDPADPLVVPSADTRPAAPTAAPDPVEAVLPSSTAAPSATPGPSPERTTPGPTEAQLLDRARASLAAQPQRALALTREHARRFPNGALTQERDVIAIEALRRLGDASGAKQRAEEFNKKYPGSAHQPKVGAP
ncbi:MAG: hypothetical protein KF718_33790 [Polyangiaceae bacterium]|nr:hypothetical protein [Polyangiaceae bacterium]